MKARSGAAIIAGLAVACAIVAYGAWRPARSNTATATPSVLVTEIRLTPGTMNATLTAYGSIQPGPGGETTIAPSASGILGSLAVAAGQRVAAGQVLAILYPDAASVAEAEKAASAVTAAESNLSHVAALLGSHLATNADLAVAAQTLRDARATLAATRDTGAGVRRAITSPFTGTVTAMLAMPGTNLAAGTPLLRVADTGRLVAEVGMPAGQMDAIKAGDPAKLVFLDTGVGVPASVTAAGAMLDPQTGLLPVQIALNVPADATLNQPLEAFITARTLQGYRVPRDAVRTDDAGDFVYQVNTRNIAHRISVRILAEAAGETLVAADIDPTLLLVVNGGAQLADGMAVRTAP